MPSKLSQGYGFNNPIQDLSSLPVVAQRAPAVTDLNYPIGQVWINTATSQAWICTNVAAGAATWALSSPGASDVDTLTGDGGGAISPLAGNITLAGGTNLTTAGAGNTITFNLDNAIALATSVTSPIYTSAAAVNINAPAGQNVVIKMGDAAGANKVSFVSSAAAEVFALNSVGTLSMGALTVVGAFTQTGGAVNLSTDNAANAVAIGTGTTARVIGIGNSAAAHVVTVGSVNGVASLTLQSGSGDWAATSTDAMTLDAAGVLEINSSAGVIGIGSDAIAQNINIGTAGARIVTIGNNTGATSVVVDVGTGNADFGVTAIAHATRVGSTTGASATTVQAGVGLMHLLGGAIVEIDAVGVLEINSSAGAINIGNDAIAQAVNLGIAGVRTVTIGNVTGATAVNINCGTAGSTYTTTNGAFALNTGTGTIGIGTDAFAKAITIGNVTGITAVNINAGSTGSTYTTTNGAFALNTGTGAIGIGTDAFAKTTTIGNGTGISSILLNCGTGAASFAANATQHVTTIGSTVGTSSTIIQSGSGKIDLAGVVGELTADFVDVSGDKITFRASPVAQSILDTCVIPTGVAATTDLLAFENGMIMEQFVIGTQTILAPRMGAAALGLTVSCDLANGDGKEYNFGAARTSSKHSFTIGTSAAFYIQWRFTALDVSALEPCYFGFRRTGANNVAYGAYTDFVGYGLNDGVAPGDCSISTRLNSAAQVDTDTNDAWADGTTHTLRINVSAAGVVTFLFDGVPPTNTQAFTFDNGDVVHPFWTHLYNATAGAGDEIYWVNMECGLQ